MATFFTFQVESPYILNMYKRSDVANILNINIETIRYYENKKLLPEPPRSVSGYRQFTKEHLIRLTFIIAAKEFGFTLREIKELIECGIADYITRSSENQQISPEMKNELDQTVTDKIDSIEDEITRLSVMKEKLIEYRDNEQYKQLKKYNFCKLTEMLDSVP